MKTKALPSFWQSLRFFSYIPHIPENPPRKEKEDVGVKRVAMVGEAA